MIDPNIWEDEHFGALCDKAKVLFIACISNADDEGRLSGNPSNLRALAFRFDDITTGSVDDLIDEIKECLPNFVVYTVNGLRYIQLQKWESYQTQRDDRRKQSRFPACQTDDGQMSDKCLLKLSKDKVSKDNINDDVVTTVTLNTTSDELRWLKFWSAYPKKIGKGAAFKAWKKIKPDTELGTRIVDSVLAHADLPAWKKDGGQYIPHPSTYLNQERWEDELEEVKDERKKWKPYNAAINE